LSPKPKVSIITVCYNAADTLKDTIDSVLEQDYEDVEYILIDGQSTDGTLDLIKSYGDRIDQFISEADKGMYDGLNKGIQMAKGEIIGMLNSDDFYTDEHVVSDMVQAMSSGPGYESGYADLYYVDSKNTNRIIRKWKSGKYKRKKFKQGWMPPHPTFFLRKEAYEKYGGFNLDFRSAADYELMLRMLYKHELKAAYLPRYIVKMRVGGMSNASLLNRLKANREDRKAWKVNGLRPGPFTLTFKPLRKVLQYFSVLNSGFWVLSWLLENTFLVVNYNL
jgi:glycosyltransferase involved in cell wall biosynthesis